MSITTSARINLDALRAALPAGVSFSTAGADPTVADAKTITFYGTDDATGQAAVTTAAAQFVDRAANQTTLQSRAQAALTANANFVNQAKPGTAATTASAAYDQAVTLSKECTAIIRLLLNLLDSTAGT